MQGTPSEVMDNPPAKRRRVQAKGPSQRPITDFFAVSPAIKQSREKAISSPLKQTKVSVPAQSKCKTPGQVRTSPSHRARESPTEEKTLNPEGARIQGRFTCQGSRKRPREQDDEQDNDSRNDDKRCAENAGAVASSCEEASFAKSPSAPAPGTYGTERWERGEDAAANEKGEGRSSMERRGASGDSQLSSSGQDAVFQEGQLSAGRNSNSGVEPTELASQPSSAPSFSPDVPVKPSVAAATVKVESLADTRVQPPPRPESQHEGESSSDSTPLDMFHTPPQTEDKIDGNAGVTIGCDDGRNSPVESDGSNSSDESAEDEMLLELPLTGPRHMGGNSSKTESSSRTLRSDTGTLSTTQRYDPCTANKRTMSTSVLDGDGTASRSLRRSRGAVVLRARAHREAKRKALNELREDVMGGREDSESEEDGISSIARAEENALERERRRLWDFETPSPLFTKPFNMQTLEIAHETVLCKVLEDQVSLVKNSMLRGVIQIARQEAPAHRGEWVGISLMATQLHSPPGSLSNGMSRKLFANLAMLVVHDLSPVNAVGRGLSSVHSHLLAALHTQPKLRVAVPNLERVLETYGACFGNEPFADPGSTAGRSEWDCADKEPGSRTLGLAEGCLDHELYEADSPEPQPATELALRNIGRALQLCASAIREGAGLCVLSAKEKPDALAGSDKALRSHDDESCPSSVASFVAAARLCTRILISPFGSLLFADVSGLLGAIVDMVPDDVWPDVRWAIAKDTAQQTTRLSVQVELITHMISPKTKRLRGLTLDITFALMRQWQCSCATRPSPRPLLQLQPTEVAHSMGLGYVSFTLADAVDCLANIPAVTPDTNAAFLCAIARLGKQAVSDQTVIERRKPGDLPALARSIEHFRRTAARLSDAVAMQDVRISLDALRTAVQNDVSRSRSAWLEMNPNEQAGLIQTKVDR